MTQPPALTRKLRNEIDGMLRLDDDGLKKDTKSEDFQRPLAVGMEALTRIKAIELRYMQRYLVAIEEKSTAFMVAAVYALQGDLGGRDSANLSDDVFLSSMVATALRTIGREDAKRWLAESRDTTFSFVRNRRALREYLDEKLAALDELVAAKEALKAQQATASAAGEQDAAVSAAASALLVEVDALLDYEDDDDMQSAADALREQIASGAITAEGVHALLGEVDAHLDGNEDAEMLAAKDALEALVPRAAAAPAI